MSVMSDEKNTKSTKISRKQLAMHNSRSDIWFSIDGQVYDVTKFLDEHPGGEEVLLENGGQDATEAFDDIGHSEDAREMLKDYLVGELMSAQEDSSATSAQKSGSSKTSAGTSNSASSSSSQSWAMMAVSGLIVAVGVYWAYMNNKSTN